MAGVAEAQPVGQVEGDEGRAGSGVDGPVALGDEHVARHVGLKLLEVVGGSPVESALRAGRLEGGWQQIGGGAHARCSSRGARLAERRRVPDSMTCRQLAPFSRRRADG